MAQTVPGRTIYVDANGLADFSNIQSAIDDSNDGDVLIVNPGIYTGHGNRDIDYLGKAITVRSTDPNDPNIVAATIVDCNASHENQHRGFVFQNAETASCVLAGLTIKNGYARMGGGILCEDSSPSISNCVLTHNQTSGWSDGGAIYCRWYSNPTIHNCIVCNNSTNGEGGGISCWWYSSPSIDGCVIKYNSADHDGGGGISSFKSTPTITQCTVSDNTARYGAGIFGNHDQESPTIAKCIITRNASDYNAGGGIQGCNGPITECIIAGNTAVYAGGGGLNRCHGPITNCIIVNNMVTNGDGGGIYRCAGPITNCLISGNWASDDAGGIDITACRNTITNCTIVDNFARDKGGGIYGWFGTNVELSNSILWNNSGYGNEIALDYDYYNRPCTLTVSNSCVQGGEPDARIDPTCTLVWGAGNFDSVPLFENPGNADYHLLTSSPCIDTGDNNSVPPDRVDLDADGNTTELIPFDLDGNARIVDADNDGNAVVDMGAYEFFVPPIQVSMKFTPQAFNPGSRGNWMKAHFLLPEGYTLEDVDADSPAVIYPPGIESDHMNVFLNDDGLVEIEPAFDRAHFCTIVTGGDPMEVKVAGSLTSGRQFYGTDTIKITTNYLKYLGTLASRWLEAGCADPDWCTGLDLNHDSMVNLVDLALFDGCCIEVIRQ
jgi:parallel beta-helix repeat protein